MSSETVAAKTKLPNRGIRISKPMLGNSNAGEEKIDPHDVSIRFYKYITIPEDDPAYLCRLISILEAVKIAILFS